MQTPYLFRADPAYIESLWKTYLQSPDSLPIEWRRFFEGYAIGLEQAPRKESQEAIHTEFKVLLLIAAYRNSGHLYATTNPLSDYTEHEKVLDQAFALSKFGLSEEDLDKVFEAGNQIHLGRPATLREIIAHLRKIYCSTVGIEYRYIRTPEILTWLEKEIESPEKTPKFSAAEKKRILQNLCNAVSFERFLHRKFVGQKRFSLEGCEGLIPTLDEIVRIGAQHNIEEFVIGMAHRGRLNVLSHILQKSFDTIFGEFEGKGLGDDLFDGDVKYHLGFSSDPIIDGRQLHLSLLPNPSHLEAVDPVTLGATRAKMDYLYGGTHDRICSILIHGEAALACQGVVYETLQLSLLPGYEVGGTLHIVLNNQIGFTTPESQARSSTYATDIAKVTSSPVFHVHGDDPEALVHVARIALRFRQAFNRDVFIEIVGYRKYGHNEGDEPRFTQPLMYKAIAAKKSPYEIYAEKLANEKIITLQEAEQMETRRVALYDEKLEKARTQKDFTPDTTPRRTWWGIRMYDDKELEPQPDTRIKPQILHFIAQQTHKVLDTFTPHPTAKKLYQERLRQVTEGKNIDWGTAEMLAYGTLLIENNPVRLSGQDAERGTFSHRHAVVHDQNTGERYIPLNHLSHQQAPFYVYNSPLSEYGVLGFEYGYALAVPNTLVIWEAQFGDFANGAQVLIDQFISAAKTKWLRLNGITLFLPHGYEGQGPEHSSARPERFLILAAENNMYICNLTTPANLFHILRHQMRSQTRRPLVLFTPKSLLRHPSCVSSLQDFTDTGFQPVLNDPHASPKAQRLIFCTGKIYYELDAQRKQYNTQDTAILRIERLYPFPLQEIQAILQAYPHAQTYLWVQEEPLNMGYWSYILRKTMEYQLPIPWEVVARKESASPATGSYTRHQRQQEYIIRKALNLAPETTLTPSV
ncbi:MAG: 2-oxoglutarate dehydrogenase E1 component [Bacteroidia bacterium]